MPPQSFANYTTQHHSPFTALLGLLSPWTFLFTSLTYLPGTLLSLPLSSLLSWPTLQDLWFSRFWSTIGPQVQTSTSPFVIPLLSGLVHRGAVVPPSAARHPGLGGTVLEIGAGSGLWASIFSDEHLPPPGTGPLGARTPITHIYGVEPNAAVHGALRARVAAAGLEGRYEIVPVGIEDLLATGRVAAGSVDCIVSVLCLCSIPEPAENIRELYKCLKPGGRWYVFEHVKAFPEQGRALSLYQAFINLFWPICIGGCNIRRDTVNYLLEAGEWSDIDLLQPPQEPWFNTVPHICGTLTK
ncbi:S-adenosyl-L-methionine-dependent methyltransferase [Podospora conica]|nr:S-adenosyl-L-methionine-dependent methyltransferase [Schizothecium conicum]